MPTPMACGPDLESVEQEQPGGADQGQKEGASLGPAPGDRGRNASFIYIRTLE